MRGSFKMDGEKIFRDPVIGFMVTEIRRKDVREGAFVTVQPISMNYEGLANDEELELAGADQLHEPERVIGIIPAAPGIYQVWGVIDGAGKCEVLGYEFPGIEPPDWEELRQNREAKRHGNNTKVDGRACV